MAIVNPEITNMFPNIFSKTALKLIKEYPTACDLSKATPQKLTRLFRHIKGNNFSDDLAKMLIKSAKNSIYGGRALKARSLMIKTNITILELLIQEKDSIDKQILDLIEHEFDDNSSNIQHVKSIPGVSDKSISVLLGECGNLKRFKDVKSFIGYLGLYPTQYQSGNSLSVGSLAKRGVLFAKKALYLAAVSSVRHNIELNKLFLDKVSRGKSKKEALVIVAKKLAKIIYSIFKYNQPYNPKRVFIKHKYKPIC